VGFLPLQWCPISILTLLFTTERDWIIQDTLKCHILKWAMIDLFIISLSNLRLSQKYFIVLTVSEYQFLSQDWVMFEVKKKESYTLLVQM
jgi:hypothetical protein